MDFQLHCGAWNQMFPVPNAVADHFLKLASPDALRVLLYLLRHGNEALTDEAIGEALSISREQVEDAFCFGSRPIFWSDPARRSPRSQSGKMRLLRQFLHPNLLRRLPSPLPSAPVPASCPLPQSLLPGSRTPVRSRACSTWRSSSFTEC